MNLEKSAKRAIQIPLAGGVITWLTFMGAIYSDLFVPIAQWNENGEYIGPEPTVQLSTYLFLIGLALFGLAALWGQTIALAVRQQQDFPLAKSAHRFTNLLVILGLVANAVYAIGTFLGAFNNYDNRDVSLLVRIFGVYVPIVIATALVVFVLLRAFVFRKDAPDLGSVQEDQERKALQRAVGLAYAIPVIGTAIAIIFGLVVYDVTRTDLDVWIWVIIQVIIVVSILIGTRFASAARSSKPLPVKPRTAGVAAVNLNLVLSILFGAVVTAMSFGFGATAIDKLRIWPEWVEGQKEPMQPEISNISLEWMARDMLPALVLLALAVVGIYQSIIVRNQKSKTE